MGYRDELIRRREEDGSWYKLTSEQRQRIEELTDQLAGAWLAYGDELDLKPSIEELYAYTVDPKERRALRTKMLKRWKANLTEVFGGKLVSRDRGQPAKLTELGRALASFAQPRRLAGSRLRRRPRNSHR